MVKKKNEKKKKEKKKKIITKTKDNSTITESTHFKKRPCMHSATKKILSFKSTSYKVALHFFTTELKFLLY